MNHRSPGCQSWLAPLKTVSLHHFSHTVNWRKQVYVCYKLIQSVKKVWNDSKQLPSCFIIEKKKKKSLHKLFSPCFLLIIWSTSGLMSGSPPVRRILSTPSWTKRWARVSTSEVDSSWPRGVSFTPSSGMQYWPRNEKDERCILAYISENSFFYYDKYWSNTTK